MKINGNKILYRVVLFNLLWLGLSGSEARAAGPFADSKKERAGILLTKKDGLGTRVPISRKPSAHITPNRLFKIRFDLPFTHVPANNFKENGNFDSIAEGRRSGHHGHLKRGGDLGQQMHMGRVSQFGKMDHSVGLPTRPGLMQMHSSQDGGIGESMKSTMQLVNRAEGAHSGNHAGPTPYLAELQQLTTLQLYPGMAMGVSLSGHGPEMWAQQQLGANGCLTFDLQHQQNDAQARLSLAMDL